MPPEPRARRAHVVSVSGGMQSALAADRVIERYGSQAVTLWFADTLVEDADLYRFLGDLERRWGKPIIREAEGRTPLQVAENRHLIPNQKVAPCPDRLKVRPFLRWLAQPPKPVTVHIGFAWWERHRVEGRRKMYAALDGVAVDFPALWRPLDYRPPEDVIRSWGIEIPRMYVEGYSHNNCGGACVKQGIRDWLRTLRWKPDLYAEYEAWEQRMRAKGGALAGYAFCRDQTGSRVTALTLRAIRERHEAGLVVQPPLLPIDDAAGCLQCTA